MSDPLPGEEIPRRVKVVKGVLLPEFPGECEPHTEHPGGYGAYFGWAEEMDKTHVQRQCRGCGLWAVWEPKPEGAEVVLRGLLPSDREEAPDA